MSRGLDEKLALLGGPPAITITEQERRDRIGAWMTDRTQSASCGGNNRHPAEPAEGQR